MTDDMIFYVGGYAEPGHPGILRCRFDPASGDFEKLAVNAELRNPSWLALHPTKPVLYAVEEYGPEGGLAALDLSGGDMRRVGAWSTGGADPCHICVSPGGGHLLVSNYTGGSLAVFALDERGIPREMTDFHRHELPAARRHGGNPARQAAAHIHFSIFSGGQVYVNDLGLNQVILYDWADGRLTDTGARIDFPPASGPRHSVFSEDGQFLYVLCELSARIHVFQRGANGGWTCVQGVSTVPETFTDAERFNWSLSAAIRRIDPRTLCASTRGHDSIARFHIGTDGTLSDRRIAPSGGRTPRDFNAVGDWLIVANQDSDAVTAFRRTHDGGYERTGAVMDAVRPTCVCVPAPAATSYDQARPRSR